MKKSDAILSLANIGVQALDRALRQKFSDKDGKPLTNSKGEKIFVARRNFDFARFVATIESEQFGTDPFGVFEKYFTFNGETDVERAERVRAERADNYKKINAEIGCWD